MAEQEVVETITNFVPVVGKVKKTYDVALDVVIPPGRNAPISAPLRVRANG